MQQPVTEAGAAYEPNLKSYDDLFPALPESTQPNQTAAPHWNTAVNNKMRIGTTVITQVFRLVPLQSHL